MILENEICKKFPSILLLATQKAAQNMRPSQIWQESNSSFFGRIIILIIDGFGNGKRVAKIPVCFLSLLRACIHVEIRNTLCFVDSPIYAVRILEKRPTFHRAELREEHPCWNLQTVARLGIWNSEAPCDFMLLRFYSKYICAFIDIRNNKIWRTELS